jgi:general secretion pathway protein A
VAAAAAQTLGAPPAPVLLRSEQDAWRELADLWRLPAGPSKDFCRSIRREQVLCFSRKLTLPLIRELGRPGIITLDAALGRPSYAILTALTDESATLQAAGTEQTVTLVALAQRWQGEFATLWRAPPGYTIGYEDGQGGPLVNWVAGTLAVAKGTPLLARNAVLNAPLKADIRAFQLARGLPSDGRLSPMTLMQLNRAAGIEEPRLRGKS